MASRFTSTLLRSVLQLRNQTSCGKSHIHRAATVQHQHHLNTAGKYSTLKHEGRWLCQKRQASSVALNVRHIDLETQPGTTAPESEQPDVDPAEVIKNLSPEEARKLKIIKLEFDVMEQLNGTVPEEMTDAFWLEALKLPSKSQRMRYYGFLAKKENYRKRKERKKEERQPAAEPSAGPEKEEYNPVPKNTIFVRIYTTTMDRGGNYRLANAMRFGQPLIFDMDYEQFMRNQDTVNLASQLIMSYGANRESLDPFHFIFTNVNPNGKVLKMLRNSNLSEHKFLGTMTDSSYLDLFPRKQLVYLSPHASETLKEVNGNDVYIVGGFNDKWCSKPVSLARAKEQGLRSAKFPLDEYLMWGSGNKSLTVDQVTKILLEQRKTKDWSKAFQHIPRRKLQRDDI